MLTNQQIHENVQAVRQWLKDHKIDCFYVSSFDPYLNEYVPLTNCHRYYFSGFTGSTASLLITREKVYLYVDGRYYEQADKEVDLELVSVMKTPMTKTNNGFMLETIEQLGFSSIAFESDRVARGLEEIFEKTLKTVPFDLGHLVRFLPNPAQKEVYHLPRLERGEDTREKLERAIPDNVAYFVSALDSIAWLTNCRGFHLPFQSTFLARAFATKERIYVFVDPHCPLNSAVHKISGVEFCSVTASEMVEKLQLIKGVHHLEAVYYDPQALNAFDYRMLKNIFPETLAPQTIPLLSFQSVKTAEEIQVIRSSFDRANQAIRETIRKTKEMVANGERVSELDFYNLANDTYRETGAIDNSFNTIAAFGANASIIHYSDPSNQVCAIPGEFVLFDSGALYESGFSTDTTRTFICGGSPSAKHKLIYTLVLKGLLQCQYAIFPEGTPGSSLDMLARQPLYRFGHDYAHGTGHGVGIGVHEGGAGISSRYTKPLKEGNLVSIEPGIYLPGFGGVRLENVALVKKHPELPGMLHFESFVKVPFEEDLIDWNLLNSDEVKWLEHYHSLCE